MRPPKIIIYSLSDFYGCLLSGVHHLHAGFFILQKGKYGPAVNITPSLLNHCYSSPSHYHHYIITTQLSLFYCHPSIIITQLPPLCNLHPLIIILSHIYLQLPVHHSTITIPSSHQHTHTYMITLMQLHFTIIINTLFLFHCHG
jgi:hypothetical protein